MIDLCRVPGVHGALVRYIDRRWSGGPRASAVVRTRLIDEWLAAALTGGARQVVLLGAGFDSRAHRASRFDDPAPADGRAPVGGPASSSGPARADGPAASDGPAFFEVDHPATQATKRRRPVATPAPVWCSRRPT